MDHKSTSCYGPQRQDMGCVQNMLTIRWFELPGAEGAAIAEYLKKQWLLDSEGARLVEHVKREQDPGPPQ